MTLVIGLIRIAAMMAVKTSNESNQFSATRVTEAKLERQPRVSFSESVVVSFLSFPIRLLTIVLMAAFLVRAMEPLRSMELTLSGLVTKSGNGIANATEIQPADGSSILSLGLAAVAIISIWLIYQTWQQHISLANNELRNRRAEKNIRR